MTLLMSGIGFGIISGAILSLSSIGFSLQFGMTNVLNLAFGMIMTLGAMTAYIVSASGGSIWVGAGVGVIVSALASLFLGTTLYRAFARRGVRPFEMAMVSLAVALIGDYLLASITHSNIYQFRFPTGAQHHLWGMVFTSTELIIITMSVVAVATLEFALHRTRLGVAIRATSANPSLGRASGIPTRVVVNSTWLISGAFCGLGGVALALSYQSVSFTTGTQYMPYILAVVIVAGIGSVGYAAAGAVVLSLVIQIAGAYGASAYNVVIALGVLLVALLVRPQGLFGQLFEKHEMAV